MSTPNTTPPTPPNTQLAKAEKFTEIVPLGSSEAQTIKLSIAMVQNLIAVKTKKGKTCSENDAVKFIAMCVARRLNPFEGDCFLIGYDGYEGPAFSLITAHQAFLKRAELNPEYDGMKSGIIVERAGKLEDLEGDFHLDTDKVKGGWATVFFKNRKESMHKRVRLERFKKNFGVWQDDPAGMICKCAEADALRSSFPTMLGGLYLKEELKVDDNPKPVAPIFTEPPKSESVPIGTIEVSQVVEEEQPSGINHVKMMRGLLELKGIKEKDLLENLRALGVIGTEDDSLDKLPADVLVLLSEQHDDIFKRIKGGK